MNVLQKFNEEKILKRRQIFPQNLKKQETHQWIKLRMNSIFDQKHKQNPLSKHEIVEKVKLIEKIVVERKG